MYKIVIIGCGNIGGRHLESCLELDNRTFELVVLDSSEEILKKNRNIVGSIGSKIGISYIQSIDELPNNIDVAIIATQSNVRLSIILELLTKTEIKYLILEKFLFQEVDDYTRFEHAISNIDTKVFVNCPLRIWPVFQAVADQLKDKIITNIHIDCVGDDIGCNGIHYLDMISFIIGSEKLEIEGFDLLDYQDAKRKGYLKLSGVAKGKFECSSGPVPFAIHAPDGIYTGFVLRISIAGKRELICTENGTKIILSGSFADNFLEKKWTAPYQSTLTASCVQDLISNGDLGLPTYATSKKFHLSLLSMFLDRLNAKKALINSKRCPIT